MFFRPVRQLPNKEIPSGRILPSSPIYGITVCGGKVELILRDEGFDRSFFLVLFSFILKFCRQVELNFNLKCSDMKLDTPEIAWHGKEPILSVDFSKIGSKWRLASAGADNDVKVFCLRFSLCLLSSLFNKLISFCLSYSLTQIWSIVSSEDHTEIEFLANLSRHTKAVNVVKFSPKGKLSFIHF